MSETGLLASKVHLDWSRDELPKAVSTAESERHIPGSPREFAETVGLLDKGPFISMIVSAKPLLPKQQCTYKIGYFGSHYHSNSNSTRSHQNSSSLSILSLMNTSVEAVHPHKQWNIEFRVSQC